MSDPEPPPPPPPPNLAPPPGYAGYESNPAAGAQIKRIGGLRTAILILLGVFVVGTVIQTIGMPQVVDAAKDLIAGDITDDEFIDDLAAYNLSGGLTLVSQVALIVLTMIWLFRIAKNHVALGRRLTWGPGWAIGSWFVPPIVYVIPFLMLRESWKAADPDVPPGDERWKAGRDTPLVWAWGVLYVVVPIVFIVVGLRQQFGAIGQRRRGSRRLLRRPPRVADRPERVQHPRRGGVGAARAGPVGPSRPSHRRSRRPPLTRFW